ncbi:hypothetical protein BWR19_04440 [Halomonas sp. 1513]|nr:TRAP transporter substrate-binding protein [Halomonas sp. 1513]APX92247.1 hypothetical protein BWR19_04440 [Halomonas sp. 1513]
MNKRHVTKAIGSTCILGLTMATSGMVLAQSYSATFAYFDSNVDFQLPAAEAFKHYIEIATDGDMEINITTVGGLGGDEREVLDQLRLGELQFMTPNAGGMAGAFPAAQVWNLPFLFAGRHIAWRVFQDRDYIGLVNDHIQSDTNGQLRFLGAAENSVRHLYTTRGPIRVPSDLDSESIKVRTMQAPMHQAVWSELGAPSVVALPAAERYTGLQTGLIDATEGGLNSAWNAGLLEVAEYVSLTAHMYDVTSYIVSSDFFESLPEDYQQVVEEAASLAIDVQNAHALVEDNRALERIIEAGSTVVEPTAEERAEWRELAEPIGRSFVEEEADPDFLEATLDTVSRIEDTFYKQ